MSEYRHTQVGWLVVLVTLGLGVVFVLTNRALVASGAGWFGLAVFAVLLLLFGTLSVTIDAGRLGARFGIGLIGLDIPLSEVETFGVVRNSWAWGWGIRRIPGGVLYNVSGLDAVELRLRDGRVYRIGTDQPHVLDAALRAILGHRQPEAGARASARVPVASGVRRALGWALGFGLIGFVVWASCMTYFEMQPPRASVTPVTFEVRSFVYGVALPLREITAVSLEPRLPRVLRRTNGFSASGVLRGHFDVQDLGRGQLFLDAGCPPYLVVRTASSYVVVGYADPQRTRALHDDLQAAWAKTRP